MYGQEFLFALYCAQDLLREGIPNPNQMYCKESFLGWTDANFLFVKFRCVDAPMATYGVRNTWIPYIHEQ